MKEKSVALIVITLLLVATIPLMKATNTNTTSEKYSTRNPEPLLQNRISPQLLEKIQEGKENPNPSESTNILIRYRKGAHVKLPDGTEVLKRFNLVPMISASAPISQIEEISRIPEVEYVYLDLKMKITSDEYPTMPLADYSEIKDLEDAKISGQEVPYNPWFGNYPTFLNETTELVGAQELWTEGLTGKNVTIAILDTGINKAHPDLDDLDDNPATCDPKILAEVSFVPYETTPNDLHGHGTHVASIAAGTGATGAMSFYGTFPSSKIQNIAILPGTQRGVAPSAYLYNVKVFDRSGFGDWSWIVSAIEWSVAHGADIISCSFGGEADVPPDQDPVVLALNEAIKYGVVVVVAAGNDGFGYFSTETPGFAPQIITVGASSETDNIAYFSSRGPEQFELHAKPDLVAPGTSIIAAFAFFADAEESLGLQIFYSEKSGTSMSTPHVSGAAALLLQAFSGATPYSIKAAMMLGADDLDEDPMAQGAGRLNVKKAYDIMKVAPKSQWVSPVPEQNFVAEAPGFEIGLNLTGISIFIENSLSDRYKFSQFFSLLESYGASIIDDLGPYTNATLVNPVTNQPVYDVFIIPDPYNINTVVLPPNVLRHYVEHNGTLLVMGEEISDIEGYNGWTGIWGITWNNTAVGGLSSHIDSHAITSGISELYFGSPLASLIVNASMNARTVAWDPRFPAVAVWEASAPAEGKVVVIADDGVLNDLYLYSSDNLQLGLNIIRWCTGALDTEFFQETRLADDVESGSVGWTSSGMWHITDHRSHSASHAWYYGQEDIWNYDNGARNIGTLISPPVVLDDGNRAHLSFSYLYETESQDSSYDQRWIYITVDGSPLIPFRQLYRDEMNIWHSVDIDLSAFMGHTVQVAFFFDTIDDMFNDFEGWYIDDVTFVVERYVSTYHEIGVGGTCPRYVIANRTATLLVNVTNFGTYTENVALFLSGVNVENVTNLAPNTSVILNISRRLNATIMCDSAGVNSTSFSILGIISMPELDYTNNGFSVEIAAVPKTQRTGENPILSVVTPMKIESLSMPLVTMFPKDFTLHNLTAFVGGGQFVNARFQIIGNVSQIADFVNVTEFTYHVATSTVIDPSPAYFTPNMTSIIGDIQNIGNISAPVMLSAELQIYIAEETPIGTYTGQVQLLNGTTLIASTNLNFSVQEPKRKILWEDYYNDYDNNWQDCERLWGGAQYGKGVSEWWKLAAEAGFDVDSLCQQLYFKEHVGFLGMGAVDPLGIIGYGGYDVLYLHDVDYNFSASELRLLKQLYESGKMDFAVLFDDGSESLSSFTGDYGISLSESWISDLVITGFDRTHPLFDGVQNFTLHSGPMLMIEPTANNKSVTTGIATATDNFDANLTSGFVVATSELEASSHYTSRLIAVADSDTFEYLEYSEFIVWYDTLLYTGEGTVVSRVDTATFAVNILKWLDTPFRNAAPEIDYFDVSSAQIKLGKTVSIDAVVHDLDGDEFNVTIAIQKPDNSWDNITVMPEGGHWLRNFTPDSEGTHAIHVVATDSYGATTILPAFLEVENLAPRIISYSISPTKIKVGEVVFVTVNSEDPEDAIPTRIVISIINPVGLRQDFNYSNLLVANLAFDTEGKAEGIYQVELAIQDSYGKTTSATIGSFIIEAVPKLFPTEEIILGLVAATLSILILMLLLIYRRLPKPPTLEVAPQNL